MSSISTLLIRNLDDAFGENDPVRRRAAIDEIFAKYLIPQMFAEVAQGKSSPAEAVSAFASKAQGIYRKWKNQGLV